MWAVVLFGAALTVAIELLCCLFRFGFKMRSREIQRRLVGIRLHHGYAAALVVPAWFLVPVAWRPWALAAAAALVLSDLVHHLVVLKLTTGRFD